MVKLMALLAMAAVVGSAAAQIKQDATESQGSGKKFGLDKKGVKLLSNRLIYGKMVSTCRNKSPGDTTSIGRDNITAVDNAEKCGLAVTFKLSDGVPFAMNDKASEEIPAEPVCGAGDNNATKIKKLKVLRAHRALRMVLVYCAKDLREVCGFGTSGDADRTCTEQVLNLCPNILNNFGMPTLDPIDLCICQKDNPNLDCFKDNQGLGNRRLLFNLGGGQKPDSDVGAKGELGGAIRSIKNCFGNNTVSDTCTSAILRLSQLSTIENLELERISKANQAVGRRQLQLLTSDDLKVLSDAADELDPPASPGSASGLGAPLALALAVLALNR
jgi:hypothetical protein